MLKFLLVGMMVSGFAAAAGDEEFAKRKEEMLANMSERIQKLEQTKACVSGASDREAMKACHKEMKEWREGQKGERKERREERKEERKARKKEEKN